jgi:hypothetical protein
MIKEVNCIWLFIGVMEGMFETNPGATPDSDFVSTKKIMWKTESFTSIALQYFCP